MRWMQVAVLLAVILVVAQGQGTRIKGSGSSSTKGSGGGGGGGGGGAGTGDGGGDPDRPKGDTGEPGDDDDDDDGRPPVGETDRPGPKGEKGRPGPKGEESSPGNGEGEDRPQGPGMKGSRPGSRPKACDLTAPPDHLDEAIRAALMAVADGTADVWSLTDHLMDIPEACMAQLKTYFEGAECNTTNLVDAVCEVKGDPTKIKALLPCLLVDNAGAICSVLLTVIEDDQCESAHLGGMYVEHCPENHDLPIESFFLLPIDRMESYVTSMPPTALATLIPKAINHLMIKPEILEELPCDKKGFLVKTAILSIIPVGTEAIVTPTDAFWEYSQVLPFMPNSICKAISADTLIAHIDDIAMLDFPCGDTEDEDDDESEEDDDDDESESVEDDDDDNGGRLAESKRKELEKQRRNAPRCQFPCGHILIKTLMDAFDSQTEAVQEKINSLVGLQQCQSLEDLIDNVEKGKCEHLGAEFFKGGRGRGRQSREVAEKCLPDKPPQNMTVTDLESMGCSLLSTGLSLFRHFPKESICDHSFLCNALQPCMRGNGGRGSNLDHIASLCCDVIDVSTLTCLGSAITRLPCDRFSDITVDADTVDDLGQGVKEMRTNGDKKEKAVGYILASKGSLSDISDSALAQYAPLEKLQDSKKPVGELFGLNKGKDPKGLSFAMKSEAKKIYLKEQAITNAEDLTPDMIREMKSLSVGLTPDELDRLDPSTRRESLRELCKVDGMKGRQSESLAKGMVMALEDTSPQDPTAGLTVDDVYEMNPHCLAAMPSSFFPNMSSEVRDSVCMRLGEHPRLQCLLNKVRRETFADLCKTLNKGAEKLQALGQLVGDLAMDDLESLSGEQLLEMLDQFMPIRCQKRDNRKMILNKLREYVTVAMLQDEEVLKKLGPFVFRMNKEKLKEAAVAVANFGERDNEDGDEERERVECCRMEQSVEDKDDADVDAEEAAAALREVILETDGTGARRKRRVRARREATVLTCENVEDLDQSTLTVENVENMDINEFMNCIMVFGKSEGHKEIVRNAIMDRIRESHGPLCDLSTAAITELGSIAYSLTPEEIGCLENFEGERSMGGYSDWSQEQLEAFATKYIMSHNLADASSLDAKDLAIMGHFMCGLSEPQIEDIPIEAFAAATSVIGTLEKCSSPALKEFAKKAVEHFTSVENWSQGHFSEAGILIGGLSADQLNMADIGDVLGWTITGIKHIPSAVMKDLKPELLRAMDRPQAHVITEEQMEEMDIERMNAVYYAQDGFNGETAYVVLEPTDPTPTRTSGASRLIGGLLCLLFAATTLLMQ